MQDRHCSFAVAVAVVVVVVAAATTATASTTAAAALVSGAWVASRGSLSEK